MNAADSTRRAANPDDDATEDDEAGDGFDTTSDEGVEELSESTGLDLTDASDLDADNVPADEEFGRTNHAPD